MVDGYFAADPRRQPAPARQLHGPPADGRAVRPLGDLGRARRGDRATRPSRSSATRRCSATRPARSTRSATSTRRQVRQLAAASASRTRSCARRRRPTCGPARPTRSRAGFSYPELDRLLFWRIDKRRSTEEMVALGFDPADGRAGRPDGRRRRVQAPGAADRQARTADGRRGLPLPAAPAGLRARVSDPRRHAVCRRHARSATSVTSPSGRSRCCAPSR